MIEDKDTLCAQLFLQQVNDLGVELIAYSLIVLPPIVLSFKVVQYKAVVIEREIVGAQPAV